MNVKLTEEQSNLFKNIAENEGFSDYKIETKSGSMSGDGYLGIITTVDITKGKNKLNLILKAAENNEKFRKNIPIRDAYLKEIFMYERVFPEFDRFQRQNGLKNGFTAVAKIFGSCDKERNECLVLENLKELGYTLWNRKVPMNVEHLTMVVAEYGKFHAVSLAMKHKEPETYRSLTEKLMDFKNILSEDTRKKMMVYLSQNGLKATKENNKAREAMERFLAAYEKFSTEDLEFSDDHIVITHGDCWSNNMMFTYENPEHNRKPKEVCLLDWQLSRTNSPVLDLAYFLFVCAPIDILGDYKRYLKIYHDNVSETLKSFSCDVEAIFPFSMLEYHWNRYCQFGLMMALMIMKILLTDSEEIPNVSETENFAQKFLDSNKFKSSILEQYNKRIIDIVTILSENKLI